MKPPTNTIQVRLSLDEGLDRAWNYLQDYYQGLDKASLMRLAISTLTRETKKNEDVTFAELFAEFDKSATASATEEEVAAWWNENKSSFRL